MISTVDVIKSAMMTDSIDPASKKYPNIASAARSLWAEGGVARFYRGFSPCIMRAAPANAIMLFTVDKVREGTGEGEGLTECDWEQSNRLCRIAHQRARRPGSPPTVAAPRHSSNTPAGHPPAQRVTRVRPLPPWPACGQRACSTAHAPAGARRLRRPRHSFVPLLALASPLPLTQNSASVFVRPQLSFSCTSSALTAPLPARQPAPHALPPLLFFCPTEHHTAHPSLQPRFPPHPLSLPKA